MKLHAVLLSIAAVLISALNCGCEPPEIERLEPLKKPETATEAGPRSTGPVVVEAQKWWGNIDQLPYEVWYVQYAAGRRIGYYQTKIEPPATATDGVNISSQGLFTLKTTTSAAQPATLFN